MYTGAGSIGELSMARRRSSESANTMIGSLAFRMLIPAISVGSDSKRISKSSRPTVADTNWRARRRREKGRRCCKDAPSVVDAEDTSASDMPHDEEGRKPGMSAIAHTAL